MFSAKISKLYNAGNQSTKATHEEKVQHKFLELQTTLKPFRDCLYNLIPIENRNIIQMTDTGIPIFHSTFMVHKT